LVDTPAVVGDRRLMAKQSPHSFKKRQKESKRRQKAREKMARRHGKKRRVNTIETPDVAERPEEHGEDNTA
jgi:hypothetical protein